MDPQRLRRIAALVLALLFAAPPAQALPPDDPGPGRVRLLVQSSPLAGLRYYAAPGLWPQLRVGDALELVRQPDNPHDERAVSVAWRGHLLGYVPRRANGAIAWAMDRGERLRARISRLSDPAERARRLELEVYLE